MRILILDDTEERHNYFKCALRGCTIAHAYTVVEAIGLLEANDKFDAMFLDHSLGTKDTGLTFIRRMIDEVPSEKWPTEAVVHSWDIDPSVWMVEDLKKVGIPVIRCPFGYSGFEQIVGSFVKHFEELNVGIVEPKLTYLVAGLSA